MDAGKLMLGFQFSAPISEDRDDWLFGDQNERYPLEILNIEDDHFCFLQDAGEAALARCIPYTSVLSFSYIAY
jgi:hypothetical protein